MKPVLIGDYFANLRLKETFRFRVQIDYQAHEEHFKVLTFCLSPVFRPTTSSVALRLSLIRVMQQFGFIFQSQDHHLHKNVNLFGRFRF